MLSRAFAWFGLLGVGVFGTLLTVAVAFGVYWMARRLSGRFWISWLLAAVTCSAFLFDMMPGPGFLSIVLFTVTLALILKAQRSGQVRTLYWLPAIFSAGLIFIPIRLWIVPRRPVTRRQPGAARGRSPGDGNRRSGAAHPAGRGSGGGGRGVCSSSTGPNSYHWSGVIANYSRAKVSYS